MSSLKLTLFGAPQVELNGQRMALKTRKAFALLAYLAVSRQPQSRETLATLFWPEFSSERAFANLRGALQALTQAFGDDWFAICRRDIAIKPSSDLFVDVHEFQRLLNHTNNHHAPTISVEERLPSLQAAAELYQDDFLRGFTLPDCLAFDEWQAAHTGQFREQIAETLRQLIGHYTEQRDMAAAIQYAQRWVEVCPWEEDAHREMMRVYAADHQRSAALQQYQECAHILREEFETEPEPETQELYRAILNNHRQPDGAPQNGNHVPTATSAPVSPPHNLPAQTTTFIGREAEVATVTALLSQEHVRLVTLTGPGGSGKTRLGLQAAERLLNHFADGVFFISFAPITNPDLVAPTMAQTLGLRISGNAPPIEALIAYLRPKRLLFVLDNFEQLIEAAPALSDLLAAAPGIKILTTSGTVLRLSGEYDYLVPPMRLPDPANLPSFEGLTRFEAIRLFAERAQAVAMNFKLTEDNAPMVAQICVRLDGLPLAIELAAARARLLPPKAMLAHLDYPLRFLSWGVRDRPIRQQTLRNTLAWSYHLLSAEEQTVFRRLAVFVGGWTLEAAEAVCQSDSDVDVFDGLQALTDHHLVAQTEINGEPRFTMLETIREYALERLAQYDDGDLIRKQHAQFFVAFAQEANTHLNRLPIEEHVRWKARLTQEIGNLRVAFAWATANVEESRQSAIHMYEPLADIFALTGQHEEARTIYQNTLQGTSEHDLIWRARLHRKIGKTWEIQGHYAEASRAYESAETVLEQPSATVEPSRWQEWIEVQVDRIWLLYWQNKQPEMIELARKAQPMVEQYGTPTQRVRYFDSLTLIELKRERYLISEQAISYALTAVSASKESENLSVINMSYFQLGFSYLWAENDKLDLVKEPLEIGLRLAEQIGDVVMQARCLTYLTVLYRKYAQKDQVNVYSHRSLNIAKIAQMPEYVGAAKANLTWLAWSEQRFSEAETDGKAALEIWRQLSFVYPFHWMALFPLIGVTLADDRVPEAVAYIRALLSPEQKRLPAPLTAALEDAIRSWDAGDEEIAHNLLRRAMSLAQEIRHF